MKTTKRILLGIVLAGLFAAALTFSSVAAAKYHAGVRKPLTGISVRYRTLVRPLPDAPPDLVFNGDPQTPVFSVPEGVTTSGAGPETHAGTYEIVLRLDDPAHDTWPDGTTGEKRIPWRILPKPLSPPVVTETDFVYDGTAFSPAMDGGSPEVVVTGDRTAAESGQYVLRFRLPDPADYIWTDQTTAEKTVPWQIGICRIGTVLYPSVTAAFATDLSSEDHPVEMLRNWAEEAVNTSGEDWFSLNGFDVTSDGVTIRNEAALTLLGGGVLSSEGGSEGAHTVLENSGRLTVADGTYRAVGENGVANVIHQTGGTVTVENGSFEAINRSGDRSATCFLQDGGEMTVLDGNFSVDAAAHFGLAFNSTAGEMTVNGGTTVVRAGENVGAAIAIAETAGAIYFNGGTHTAYGTTGTNGIVVHGASACVVTAGIFDVRVPYVNLETCNGILISGGSMRLEGGEVHVNASLLSSVTGIATTGGEAVVTGGVITVRSEGPIAYGMNAPGGRITVSGLDMTVTAPAGSAYGFIKTYHEGVIEVQSGRFTVRGDHVIAGQSSSPSSPLITPAANAACAFILRYRSTWTAGTQWTHIPYVASVTQELVFNAFSRGGAAKEYGVFSVNGGCLNVFPGGSGEPSLSIPAEDGMWQVTERTEDGARVIQLLSMTRETDSGELPAEVFQSFLSADAPDFSVEAGSAGDPLRVISRPTLLYEVESGFRPKTLPDGTEYMEAFSARVPVGFGVPLRGERVELRVYRSENALSDRVEIVCRDPEEAEESPEDDPALSEGTYDLTLEDLVPADASQPETGAGASLPEQSSEHGKERPENALSTPENASSDTEKTSFTLE